MSEKTDRLAVNGGVPVRDQEQKPWPRWPDNTPEEWDNEAGPALREVYLSRVEGLPRPKGKQFSQAMADYCGAQHGVLMPHGTNAIAAAVAGVLDVDGLSDGGEIIIPNYTFIASASAPLFVGCSLCFVDIDPDSATLDPGAVEAAIGPRTRAILPVHLAGQTADMDALGAIASKHSLALIEDAAHAHGAEYNGRRAGSLGDAGAFSFQSSKNLTSGEGGLVTTNDAAIRDRVTAFMDVGRRPDGARWEYPRLGWNYRTSEYLAALLLLPLGELDGEIDRRSRNAAYLAAQLEQIEGVAPPRLKPWATRHAYHLYAFTCEPEAFGDEAIESVAEALRAEGVPCFRGYDALSGHEAIQSVMRNHPERIRVEPHPNVVRTSARTIWLPQTTLLATETDMDDIAEAMAKIQRAFAGGEAGAARRQ